MTLPSYPDTQLLIANTWVDAADGRTQNVVNLANGQVLGTSRIDLDLALAVAQRGFDTWRHIPAIERARLMRKAAALLRERAHAIAPLLTMEQGKPLPEARAEVLAAVDIIDVVRR